MLFVNRIVLLFVVIAITRPAYAETLTLLADPWCPYNCSINSDLPGIGIEVATSIFNEQGIAVDYIERDWQQAIDQVRSAQYPALMSAYRSDVPDFIFPKQAYAFSQMCFFNRRSDDWRYSGLNSLRDATLGAIVGYSYGRNIDRYIAENSSSSSIKLFRGVGALDLMLTDLTEGAIDVLLEDRLVFGYRATELALDSGFQRVGCQPQANLYIAFSPAKPQQSQRYAEIFSRGIDAMRKSGELQSIYRKYGLIDE